MIHPDTELRFVSKEVGYGVFATNLLPKGTILYARDKLDLVLTPKQYKALDLKHQDLAEKYSYIDKDGNRITMKVQGPLVDMLEKLDCSMYHDKVVWERKERVLYLHVKRTIYGMLQSALLFYNKLRTDLEEDGFEINPYDSCVANKTVDGKQLTVV